MQKTIAAICAAAVSLTMLGTALPANAAPAAGTARLLQVAMHSDHRPPPRFERRGSYAYYNGHRGDRHYHRGWRQYNGYWFPPAAFVGAAIGAAILGGIIHNSTRH